MLLLFGVVVNCSFVFVRTTEEEKENEENGGLFPNESAQWFTRSVYGTMHRKVAFRARVQSAGMYEDESSGKQRGRGEETQ
jgi:hypothetical protein